jgi:hypothetical protein
MRRGRERSLPYGSSFFASCLAFLSAAFRADFESSGFSISLFLPSHRRPGLHSIRISAHFTGNK